MKRFIALFLTLALLVSCVPAALAAEDEVPEETPALLEEYEAEEETTETTEESTEAEPVVTEAAGEATEAATEVTEAATEAAEATEAATEATEEATEAATEATEVTEETTEATTEETTEEATEETSALLEEEEPEEEPEEEEEELDPAMAMLKGLTTETEKAWSDAPTNVYVKQTAANKLYISWDASRYASSFVVYEVKYNSYGQATGVKKVGATNSTSITITVSKGAHVYGIFPCSRAGGKGDLGDPAVAAYNVTTQNWRKAPTITAQQDTAYENTIIVKCKYVNDAVGYILNIAGNLYVYDADGDIVEDKCVIQEDAPKIVIDEVDESETEKAAFSGFVKSYTFVGDKFTDYIVSVTGVAVGVVDGEGNLDYGKEAKTVKVKMTPQWVKAPKLTVRQSSSVEPKVRLWVDFTGEPDYINIYEGKNYLCCVPVDEDDYGDGIGIILDAGTTGSHSYKAIPSAYQYGRETFGKASAAKKVNVKIKWMTDKIKVTAKETEAGKVSLSWVPMDGISEYQVWYKVGKNPEQQVGNGTTSYSYMNISGVQRGVKYTFTVKPVYNGKVGKGGSVTITPKLKASAQRPTYRALLIGNTYGGDLPGCDRDARSMASLLGTMTATPYKVTTKLDVTASTIKSSIASAFSGAQSTDVSLFYYSGHGATNTGKLVGTNNTYLSFSELRTALDKIPGDKIVILDSCYSGNAINKSEGEATEADMEAYVNAAMETFSNEAMSKSGELAAGRYYVMTACRKTQTSASITKYSGESYGLFTNCFEQACGWDELNSSRLSMSADANGDGKVTLSEAYNKTDALVKQFKKNNSYLDIEQITAVNPASSSFVLFGRK